VYTGPACICTAAKAKMVPQFECRMRSLRSLRPFFAIFSDKAVDRKGRKEAQENSLRHYQGERLNASQRARIKADPMQNAS
jgi:hypothetical protein